MRVFGACGFEGATMERIAREADVAKGTIYLYYASKQSIYDAALRSGFADLDERTRAALEQAGTLREAISAFIATRAAFFFERPDFFCMYVAAIANQIIDAKARPSEIHAMVERQTRRLAQAVERAVTRREIRRVDPAATTLAIFDLTRGLVVRRLMARAGPDATSDALFLADLIWRGLRGGAAETRERASTKNRQRAAAKVENAAQRQNGRRRKRTERKRTT